MKKLLAVLLIALLALTGCSKQEPTVGGPGSTWDCVEYTSLDEMNEVLGINIQSINDEVSDEWFGIISNSIAQYKFKINDEDWCIRGSKDVDNDISGLNYESITFEKDVEATFYTDEVYAHRFFKDDCQYVISVDTKDKDIAMSYFDKVCGEIQTNITGFKSGYENEIFEDGDDVVYRVTYFYDDASTMTMEIIYTFEDDKMVSNYNRIVFDNEEAAQDYYDDLVDSGYSADDLTLEGNTITTEKNTDVDFYSDYTKAGFIEMMKSSMAQ